MFQYAITDVMKSLKCHIVMFILAQALHNLVNIIRCLLIDIIIYPVAEQEIGMRSPRHPRALVGLVVKIIILGHGHVITLAHVAFILFVQCVGSIFQVPGKEKLTATACHHHAHATVWRLGNNCQICHLVYILSSDLCMPTVGHHKEIVETSKNRQVVYKRILAKNAKHLLLQSVFRNVVKMIKGSLGSPTDIECGLSLIHI